MTATAHPKVSMRPFLPADTPLLAEIFRASIEELTVDDYSEAKRAAWASAADDLEAFGARLAGQLTLLGTMGGSPVGFASLKGAGRERQRGGFLQAARFCGAAPQHDPARGRMARQYHDGQEAGREGERPMSKPNTPFPRHWLYYITLKFVVIAAAIVLAIYIYSRVF